MKTLLFLLFWLLQISNILFLSANLHTSYLTVHTYEQLIDKHDVYLSKLFNKILDVTKPEYKEAESKLITRHVELALKTERDTLNMLKSSRSVYDSMSICMAGINIVLSLMLWHLSRKTTKPSP
jgi:hypothetical protein